MAPFFRRKNPVASAHKEPVILAPAYRKIAEQLGPELEGLGKIASKSRLSWRAKKRAVALLAEAKAKAITKLLEEYDYINITHDAEMGTGKEAWPELQLSNPMPSQTQRSLFKERFGHRPNPKITDIQWQMNSGGENIPTNGQLSMNSVHNALAANTILATVPGIETGSLLMPDHIVPVATINGNRFVMDSRLGGDKAVLTEKEYRQELKDAHAADVHILKDVATRMASEGRLTDAGLKTHMSYSPGNAAAQMALHTEWGKRHYANRDYTRASHHARRSVEAFPQSAEAWTNYGATLMSLGGSMMAGIKEGTGERELWRTGEVMKPESHPQWGEAQKLHRDAVTAFSKALEINPSSISAIEGKGYSFFHMGQEEAAKKYFLRARQMRIARDKAAVLRGIEKSKKEAEK